MLKNDWNLLVQDESIFIHDYMLSRKRKWIIKEKRSIVNVTGSHSKTIVYDVLSLDGKQLFRQYDRFDSHSFMFYLDEVRKKFKKFIMFVDRASQHRSKKVQEYLQRNSDNMKVDYFPVGSPEFNAVEECWRQEKYDILSRCYSSLSHIKKAISNYYRTRRFNLDVKRYLLRSTN